MNKRTRQLAAAIVAQSAMALLPAAVPVAMAVEVSGCATETVASKAGPVCGKVTDTASGKRANAFLGIPFAESTALERRWTPPVPKGPWTKTMAAVQFGPSCPQSVRQPNAKPPVVENDRKIHAERVPTKSSMPAQPRPESEDCLSLNVWTPAGTKPGAGLPVMVFIHGGAFVLFDSSDPMYDGAHLAASRNVVLVSVNYRLGVLGFLAADGITGNYGFMDQQLALSWVRDNIRAFGGDPGKVTIFGESSGAMSVGLHLYSAPGSAGLFRAAIMQSNFLALPYKTLDDQVNVGNIFKQAMNCRDVQCLRGKDVDDLLVAQFAFTPKMSTVFSGAPFYIPFAPAIDGVLLVRQPLVGAARGVSLKPILLGTNKDEAIPFVEGSAITPADHSAWAASLFGREFERVVGRYPPQSVGDNMMVAARLRTHYFMTCSTRYLATAVATPVHAYLFNHQPTFQVWGGAPCQSDGNVCHGAELPFVFHSADRIGGRFSAEEEKLSNAVMDRWTNFAAHLDPDGDPSTSPVATRWPRFSRQARDYLVFDVPALSVRTDPDREVCEFWDGIGYNLIEPWGRAKAN